MEEGLKHIYFYVFSLFAGYDLDKTEIQHVLFSQGTKKIFFFNPSTATYKADLWMKFEVDSCA